MMQNVLTFAANMIVWDNPYIGIEYSSQLGDVYGGYYISHIGIPSINILFHFLSLLLLF